MNDKYYRDEVEIDLIQFFKRICVQWRAVVAVALIFGILALCGKYIKDDHAYRAFKTKRELEEASDTSIEDLEKDLTEEEISAVYLAVNRQQQIESKSAYLRDSIYMNLNPDGYKTVTVLYKVETDGDTDAYDVCYLYRVYLNQDDVISSMNRELGFDVDDSYVRELYNVESTHSDYEKRKLDYFSLSFYVPENVNEADVETALKNAVESCGRAVGQELSYSISLNKSYVSQPSQSDRTSLEDEQLTARSSFESLNSTQKEKVEAFSEEQKALYQTMLKANASDLDEDSREEDAIVEKEGELLDTVLPASFSVKYFALGIFLGIVLYCGIYFVYIILNPYAVELSVSGITTMPCLGLLTLEESKKKSFFNFLLRDEFVYNLLFRAEDERLSNPENIIGQMQVYAGDSETKKVQILQVGSDVSGSSEMQRIVKVGNDMGVDVSATHVDVNNVRDVLSKLDDAASVVVCICETKTLKKDVHALYEVLRNQKTTVLGELFVLNA